MQQIYYYSVRHFGFFCNQFDRSGKCNATFWYYFFKGALWSFWPLVVLWSNVFVSASLFCMCTRMRVGVFTLFRVFTAGSNTPAMYQQHSGRRRLVASKHWRKQSRFPFYFLFNLAFANFLCGRKSIQHIWYASRTYIKFFGEYKENSTGTFKESLHRISSGTTRGIFQHSEFYYGQIWRVLKSHRLHYVVKWPHPHTIRNQFPLSNSTYHSHIPQHRRV